VSSNRTGPTPQQVRTEVNAATALLQSVGGRMESHVAVAIINTHHSLQLLHYAVDSWEESQNEYLWVKRDAE